MYTSINWLSIFERKNHQGIDRLIKTYFFHPFQQQKGETERVRVRKGEQIVETDEQGNFFSFSP